VPEAQSGKPRSLWAARLIQQLTARQRKCNFGAGIGVDRGSVSAQHDGAFEPSSREVPRIASFNRHLCLRVRPSAGGSSQDTFHGGVAGGDLKEDGH
jgi:hypothetical protein